MYAPQVVAALELPEGEELVSSLMAAVRHHYLVVGISATRDGKLAELLDGRKHDDPIEGPGFEFEFGESKGVAGVGPGRPDRVDPARATGHSIRGRGLLTRSKPRHPK